MRRLFPVTLALLLPAAAVAQQAHEHGPAPKIEGGGVFPAGWQVRPDEGGTLPEIKIEVMAPGWHMTTAASGIMYRPTDTGSGTFEVSAKLHLFPEGPGHLEAYGVFIGGKDLSGAGQRYTYFLLRGDGTWKVKRRSGAATTEVTADWTANPAILKESPTGPVANVLLVSVAQGRARFLVNGREVWSAPASSVDVDGISGLRLNHNLSVHVESLMVTRR
ncbi:MAG: hypothetical protein ABI587_05100 [Gemmatimonadales bacterium]